MSVEGSWAKPVREIHVSREIPAEAVNRVEGKRVAALTGGFGKMWEKHYRIALDGTDISPTQVIKTWMANFGDFWPANNRFFGPLVLTPGEVALLSVGVPGGVKLSTGVMVLYADDESFAFITPEGHMFNGMITFSAREVAGTTFVHIDAIIRPQDPLTELGMMFGGHRKEDRFWMQTLERIAAHFGADAKATTQRVVVDKRRQWRHFGNIRRSIGLRPSIRRRSA